MVPLHPLRGGSAALQQEPLNGCGLPPDQPAAEGSAASCRQQLHSALLLIMARRGPAERGAGLAAREQNGGGGARAEGVLAAGPPRARSHGGAAPGLAAHPCRWRPDGWWALGEGLGSAPVRLP